MKLEEKINLLTTKGYQFVFDRDIYCNLSTRKCFSLEFVEDNSPDDIVDKLSEPSSERGIDFYFNEELSCDVQRGLEEELIKLF